MFAWLPAEERAKYGPHEWVRANLGHSNSMCKNCGGTPRELEYTGDMNHCEKAAPAAEDPTQREEKAK